MTKLRFLIPFLLALMPLGVCAQTITPGSTTTQLSPSQRSGIASYWPDGNMCAVVSGSNYDVFAPTANPGTQGISLSSMATWSSYSTISTATNLQLGGSGAFDQMYIGGGSCYYDTTIGKLIAMYHGEQHGTGGTTSYSALGLAFSSDYGTHWTKLGEVISPQTAWGSTVTPCQSEVSNGELLPISGYFYAYYNDQATGCPGPLSLAVARASISAVESAVTAGTPFTSGAGTLFMKYTGSGTWTGDGVTNLANPSLGGGAFTPIATVGSGSQFEPNVRYDSATNSYIMVYIFTNSAQTTSEIDAQTSTDGVNFSGVQQLVTGGNFFGGTNMIYYPTLFNTSGSGDPQTLGTNFSVFWVQPFNPPSGGWTASYVYSKALSVPNVINCPSGFASSGACAVSATPGTTNFWFGGSVGGSNPSLSGTQVDLVPTASPHSALNMNYITPVNVQAFTTTFTFVPNGWNIAFVLQNNTNTNGADTGQSFTSGAGCEGSFYQGFATYPPFPNNVFVLDLDSSNYLNGGASFYSSAQIYQQAQSPCDPNDGQTYYYLTFRNSTSPVPLTSPATSPNTTTGHTYSATINYDGTTVTLNMFDVTAGGSCPGASCYTQTWSAVNIPSLVGANTAYVGLAGATNASSTSPLYVNSLVYTVNSPPSSPSVSTYTTTTAAGGNGNYAAAPTFSPVAGTYSGTQSVTISSSTSGNNICYILSASTPTIFPQTNNIGGCAVGTLYTGPVSVSTTQTLYAMAGTAAGVGLPSALTVGAYTIGGTIAAASCNTTDVQTALNSVTSSTTLVTIPSGTCAWTSGITWTVPSGNTNLTIQGATTVSCSGTPGQSGYACTPTDSTIIQDAYQSNNALMDFTVGSSGTFFRVTGITFAGGNVVSSNWSKYNGIIEIFNGTSQNMRFDHNHFNFETYTPLIQATAIRIFASATGVADHNLLDLSATNNTYQFGVSIDGPINDTIGNGDGTWAHPTTWGTYGPFYIESNIQNGGVINDCDHAGQFVVRYNNSDHASVMVQTHATKSQGGPIRGCRAYEMYNNYLTGPTGGGQASAGMGSKDGASMVFNNVMASGFYRFDESCTDRNCGSTTETNTPNGWGFCGTQSLSASTGLPNGVGSGWDGNSPSTTGYPCLDGLGRGQTQQALNGANFPNRLNSSTGTIAWPQQYLEPIYMWNNSIGSASYWLNAGDLTSQSNRDYYYDAGATNPSCSGAFNGTCGTGFGLASARPATCTPGPGGTYGTSPTGSYGVAYWETDNQQLDICTAPNTWKTGTYKPAGYPHPLVGGTSYSLTVSTSGSGSGSVTGSNSSSGTYASGTTIGPLTATPTGGSTFAGWSGVTGSAGCSGTTNPCPSFSIGANTTINAIFNGGALTCGAPTQTGPNYSGTYTSPPTVLPIAVGFSSPTAGCVMHATFDGSAPTCSSATYAGPYSISVTETIRVIACQTSYANSSVIGGTWTIINTVPPTILQILILAGTPVYSGTIGAQ